MSVKMMESQVEALKHGTRVRYRKKGDLLYETGTVDFVWNCCGEPAVQVITPDGPSMNILPTVGDEIELI